MILVLNLGLKSIRSIIFDENFEILSSSAKPLTTYMDNLAVEQCADEWWQKALSVIDDSINKLSQTITIKTFTVTASSCCMVPVNRNGEPLSRVMMVSDKRAFRESEEIEAISLSINSQNPNGESSSNSSLMLPKIKWLLKNRPETFHAAHYYLSPNDYFIYRLSGHAVTDILNAEKCGYDKFKNEYDADLINEIGLPMSRLPKVLEPGTEVGKIVNYDVPPALRGASIALSTYDAICAFVGAGPNKIGDACDVSGTVTSLRVLAEKDIPNLKTNGVFVQNEPCLDIAICGASNNLGGGLIEWHKQVFYKGANDPYGLMEAEAASRSETADCPLFLPYLMGERAPLWNDNARGVFFGLSRHHQREHLTKAVFEGAAFSLKLLSDEVKKNATIDSVSVSGGLARLNYVNQVKADVLNREVKVLSEFETTAIGAYVFAMIASGVQLSLSDVASHTSVRQVIHPNEINHKIYLERFDAFKSVYKNLLPNFEDLAKISVRGAMRSKETVENL
jgi:xylulokinase